MEGKPVDSDAGSSVQSLSSIRSGLFLTVAAWLTSHLVVGAAYLPVRSLLAFDPKWWTRWDSFNYVSIAVHGTTFGKCRSPAFAAVPNPRHNVWCGTAGWLPGYPWMIRPLHALGMDASHAGLLIAWFATATALFLVWYGWCRDLSRRRSFVVLVLFGLFPGAVYNFAVFPTSVALAFVIGALVAAVRERFILAALLMICAGLCYPSAWFAALGLAIALVVVAYPRRAEMVRRGLWGLLGLASLVLLVTIDHPWNAYFQIDGQHGLSASGPPGIEFLRLVFTQRTPEQLAIDRFSAAILAVQGIVAVLIAALAGMSASLDWRRHVRAAPLVYPAVTGVAVVLGLFATNRTYGAWNRSIVLAAPCVLCLRRLPIGALCALAVVTGVTTALISRSFFIGSLV